jgi:hypothetical protein
MPLVRSNALRQQEMVSPKQRDELNKRRAEYAKEFNDLLSALPENYEKINLIQKRDHCLSKFPIFPLDLSIWVIAYYEDWMRDYRRLGD